MIYEPNDKWLFPIWLDGDSRILYQDGDSNQFTISFEPGWYYNIQDPSVDIDFSFGAISTAIPQGEQPWPFLTALQFGINQGIFFEGGSNEIEIVESTPSISGYEDTGFGIEWVQGSDNILIKGTGEDEELMSRMVGIDTDEDDDLELVIEPPSGGTQFSLFGQWNIPVKADDKRLDFERNSFSSGFGRGQHYVNHWEEKKTRLVKYFDVEAKDVRRDPPMVFGQQGQRGDENNKFIDLWTQGSETTMPVLLDHGGKGSMEVNSPKTYCVFEDQASFSSADSTISDLEGGERYELEFNITVTEEDL